MISAGSEILHYNILEKIGEGGMGVVYKAMDTKLDRVVALKCIADVSPKTTSRFLCEARSAARLSHPNICQVYGIEQAEGRHFIVMEYIRGVTLEEWIRQQQKTGSPDTSVVLNVSIQIARGLEAAHRAGLVHRDIKSSNIMVTDDGVIKILDFGLAAMHDTPRYTRDGSTLGTVMYMSPEQIRGEPADSRSDIWAAGVVMYEMAAGKPPFDGNYEHSVMYSVLNTDPPPLSEYGRHIPPGLIRIIDVCLKKKPEERYASATELLQELGDFKPEVADERAEDKSGGLGFIRKTVAAGILMLLILGVIYLTGPVLQGDSGSISAGEGPVHVAVLPFTNIGDDPARQVFSDGLVETITGNLSLMNHNRDELWIVPAGEIRSTDVRSASDAHRLFGVRYAIAGSLQLISDRLRLTLTLIDSENLRQLQASVIDVSQSDILELHNRSVENLMAMLNLELADPSGVTEMSGNTTSPEAFELYIEGVGNLQRFESREFVDAAIEKFSRAVAADPGFALAYAGLAQANWRKFELTNEREWVRRAEEHIETARTLDENLVQVQLTLGMIHRGTGRHEEAVRYYNRVLSSDPLNSEAYSGLAQVYEQAGDIRDAEAAYRRAIRLQPDLWIGYNLLGGLYLRHGRYEEAQHQFERVIELSPENYRGYTNMGNVYYYTSQPELARQMYERSMEIGPNIGAASNLGTLYYADGDMARSAEMYHAALEINDRDHRLWGNLASAYYWNPDRRSEASSYYQKALELAAGQFDINPEDADVMIDMAGYHAMLGHTGEARELVMKALNAAGENATIMYLAGAAYERLGEREEAITWLRKAVENGYPEADIRNQPELQDLVSDQRYTNELK